MINKGCGVIMKKSLFLIIITLLLLGACGTNEEGQEESTSTPKTTVASETTEGVEEVEEVEEEKEVVVIPTERTIDTGKNDPWWYFTTDQIAEHQENGETIYLYSDAEELENNVKEFATANHYTEEAPKEEAAETKSKYLSLFVDEVSQVVNNESYFNKLNEVVNSLDNLDYESIPGLIEEAKQLRESE